MKCFGTVALVVLALAGWADGAWAEACYVSGEKIGWRCPGCLACYDLPTAPYWVTYDSDLDGVVDREDNCTDAPNPGQIDADADGFGNECDADYDNDGVVGLSDFNSIRLQLGLRCDDAGYRPEIDHNADCVIGMPDIAFFRQQFGGTPGPSYNEQCSQPGLCISIVEFVELYQSDDDGDVVMNGSDNCRYTPNPRQLDPDGDGIGNACDPTPLCHNESGECVSYDDWSFETLGPIGPIDFAGDCFPLRFTPPSADAAFFFVINAPDDPSVRPTAGSFSEYSSTPYLTFAGEATPDPNTVLLCGLPFGELEAVSIRPIFFGQNAWQDFEDWFFETPAEDSSVVIGDAVELLLRPNDCFAAERTYSCSGSTRTVHLGEAIDGSTESRRCLEDCERTRTWQCDNGSWNELPVQEDCTLSNVCPLSIGGDGAGGTMIVPQGVDGQVIEYDCPAHARRLSTYTTPAVRCQQGTWVKDSHSAHCVAAASETQCAVGEGYAALQEMRDAVIGPHDYDYTPNGPGVYPGLFEVTAYWRNLSYGDQFKMCAALRGSPGGPRPASLCELRRVGVPQDVIIDEVDRCQIAAPQYVVLTSSDFLSMVNVGVPELAWQCDLDFGGCDLVSEVSSTCSNCVFTDDLIDIGRKIFNGELWEAIQAAGGVAKQFHPVDELIKDIKDRAVDFALGLLGLNDDDDVKPLVLALQRLTRSLTTDRGYQCNEWAWCEDSGIFFLPPEASRLNQPPLVSLLLGPGLD